MEVLGVSRSSVGYCHVGSGCKYALSGLPGSNGIARSRNETIYVTSTTRAELRALRRRPDDTLEVVELIYTGGLRSLLIYSSAF